MELRTVAAEPPPIPEWKWDNFLRVNPYEFACLAEFNGYEAFGWETQCNNDIHMIGPNGEALLWCWHESEIDGNTIDHRGTRLIWAKMWGNEGPWFCIAANPIA